jgi:hypothetical protein
MGLDVYVGPLTRYYSGNWQTIVQQMMSGSGVPVQVIRPNQGWFDRLRSRLGFRGPDAARAVRRWRDRLRRELHIADLDWNEDPEAEYATDKPAWDCYGALILWAVYEEIPNAARRETAEGWEKDTAYRTSRENPNSRYRHLLADTEIWLPVEFDAPTRTDAIVGDSIVVGSSPRLLAELRELNSRTWNADDRQISQWRRDGADYGAPLEISARFGFCIFYELVRRSVAARLPMKLDY